MAIQFTTTEHGNFSLIEFIIDGGVCEPSDLTDLTPPDVDGTKGVIISGRGPVWLYAALAHHYHTTQWVATFDPRLGGAVVTSRHSRTAPPVGSVVELPKKVPE
jgi:CRISPR-associated protein Csx3